MTGASKAGLARRRPGPLIAPGVDGTGWLFVAIAVLSLAAALIAIAAVVAGGAAEGWRDRLAGSATVVVRAAGLESRDAAAARAAEALGSMGGVARAWPLEAADTDPLIARLVEGASSPAPARLVAVDFKPGRRPDAAALARALGADGLDAGVDDHRWLTSPVLRAVALAGLAAAGLLAAIAGAMAAAVAFATRRRLAARRDLVDLLRLAGAGNGFIGGLFAARSAATAALAGAAGVALAVLGLAAWRLKGEGPMPYGLPPFPWEDLAAGLAWPFVAALVGVAAARLAVRAALKRAP